VPPNTAIHRRRRRLRPLEPTDRDLGIPRRPRQPLGKRPRQHHRRRILRMGPRRQPVQTPLRLALRPRLVGRLEHVQHLVERNRHPPQRGNRGQRSIPRVELERLQSQNLHLRATKPIQRRRRILHRHRQTRRPHQQRTLRRLRVPPRLGMGTILPHRPTQQRQSRLRLDATTSQTKNSGRTSPTRPTSPAGTNPPPNTAYTPRSTRL